MMVVAVVCVGGVAMLTMATMVEVQGIVGRVEMVAVALVVKEQWQKLWQGHERWDNGDGGNVGGGDSRHAMVTVLAANVLRH